MPDAGCVEEAAGPTDPAAVEDPTLSRVTGFVQVLYG